MKNEKVYSMSFAKVYPLLVRKDRTTDEVAKGKSLEKILRK